MKLIDDIVSLFAVDGKRSVNDYYDKFEIIIQCQDITVPKQNELDNLIKKIPSRDSLYINTNLDGEDVSFPTGDDVDSSCFIEDLSKIRIEQDSNIEFSITILKGRDNESLSVYSLTHFLQNLTSQSLSDALNIFKKILRDYNFVCIETLDLQSEFGTETIRFMPWGTCPTKGNVDRSKIVKRREDVCHFINSDTYHFIPDDFHLTMRSGNDDIDLFFDRLSTTFSMSTIFNLTEIKEDSLRIKLGGYKPLQQTIDFNDICSDNVENYYQIYLWIYADGRVSDKLGLARNMLSLDVKGDVNKISEDIMSSIMSGFEIYLKENIQKYLEIKNTATDRIIDISQKAQENIDNMLSTFKQNLFAILTFFITLIVLNSINDGKFKNIFSSDITYISYSILALSLMYCFISLNELNKKTANLEKYYSSLKTSYSDILYNDDIDNVFGQDTIWNGNKEFLNEQARIYSIFWVICIGLFFFLTTILHTHFYVA